jgi:hypothetical protein
MAIWSVVRWYGGVEWEVMGLGGDVTALDPGGLGGADTREAEDPTCITVCKMRWLVLLVVRHWWVKEAAVLPP